MVIEIFKDSKDALHALTSELIYYIEHKNDGKPFNLALSGGETAKQMFSIWVNEYSSNINWTNIRFFWVDERCVNPDDKDSNYGQAYNLLFNPLGIPAENIHRIHGEADPETEAIRYSSIVKDNLPYHGNSPYFDCIILGIGNDAHTASLFPDRIPLLTDSRNYAVSQHPETHQQRITMTGTLILNGSPLLIPAPGSGKYHVIEKVIKGYSDTNATPAAYILSNAGNAIVYTSGGE